MPNPVTTSELLLQQIADDLRDVKTLLQQGSTPEAPAQKPAPAKKPTGGRPKTSKVDGR